MSKGLDIYTCVTRLNKRCFRFHRGTTQGYHSKNGSVVFLLIITYFFYTHNLLKSFNPRKVPLLSSDILLYSRFLAEKKNISFENFFWFYVACYVSFLQRSLRAVPCHGFLSDIDVLQCSWVIEHLQVFQRSKALKSSRCNTVNVVVFQISNKIT